MLGTATLLYVDEGVPAPSQLPVVDIELAAGETLRLSCSVVGSSGAAVNLSGRRIVYAADEGDATTPVVNRRLGQVSDLDGQALLVIASSETALLARGHYRGRFWLVDGAGLKAPVSAVSTLRITAAVAPLDDTDALPPSEGVTLTNSGLIAFADEMVKTVTYDAPFAVPVLPDVPAPFSSAAGISLTITAYSETGFTVEASAAFTGTARYTAIGEAA